MKNLFEKIKKKENKEVDLSKQRKKLQQKIEWYNFLLGISPIAWAFLLLIG